MTLPDSLDALGLCTDCACPKQEHGMFGWTGCDQRFPPPENTEPTVEAGGVTYASAGLSPIVVDAANLPPKNADTSCRCPHPRPSEAIPAGVRCCELARCCCGPKKADRLNR